MSTLMHLKRFASKLVNKIVPMHWKELNEWLYWKNRKRKERILANQWYEYFYTTHFGLDSAYYDDKIILDIGCGPRGSLEWASMALRRIGLDPLAKRYLKLGANQHFMEYIDAPSEKIPLNQDYCDAVFSFNSLDHVEDVKQTVSEIKRVTKPDGIFLLIVEVNHPPTDCEPHKLAPDDLIEYLKPEFECGSLQVYRPVASGIYSSIRAGEKLPHPEFTRELGYMSARFRRTTDG